jgi:hypothetical protein
MSERSFFSRRWPGLGVSLKHGGPNTTAHRNTYLSMSLKERGFAGRALVLRGIWRCGVRDRRSILPCRLQGNYPIFRVKILRVSSRPGFEDRLEGVCAVQPCGIDGCSYVRLGLRSPHGAIAIGGSAHGTRVAPVACFHAPRSCRKPTRSPPTRAGLDPSHSGRRPLRSRPAPPRRVRRAGPWRTGGKRASTQKIKLILVETSLEPQQQTVIAVPRRIDCLLIDQDCVDDPTHLDQLSPIAAIAGEARDLPGADRANLRDTDLGHHPLEAGALHAAGRRTTEIFLDHFDLGEAQRRQPIPHGVLQRAALAVVQHLVARGLAQ